MCYVLPSFHHSLSLFVPPQSKSQTMSQDPTRSPIQNFKLTVTGADFNGAPGTSSSHSTNLFPRLRDREQNGTAGKEKVMMKAQLQRLFLSRGVLPRGWSEGDASKKCYVLTPSFTT